MLVEILSNPVRRSKWEALLSYNARGWHKSLGHRVEVPIV